MSTPLLWLQLGALALVALAALVPETVYRRLRARLWPAEQAESAIELPRWYRARPVETGILEVAFALTGVAIALPAFIQPAAATPAALVWGFQSVLLVAALLSASASLLLYKLYVQQLADPDNGRGPPAERAPAGPWSWLWRAGPYSLLAYALVMMLVGLGLLGLIVAYGAA